MTPTTPLPQEKNPSAARAERRKRRISALFLVCAVLLLLHTCRVCIPSVGACVDRALEQGRKSAAWQAFSALCDGLSSGSGAVEAFSRSYQVLTGDAA